MDPARELLDVIQSLPLIRENVFLNMQAQQVAVLDQHVSAHEASFLGLWEEREKFPAMESMFLIAVSQCWVFSLYELLRTWRQLGRECIAHADEAQRVGGASDAQERITALRQRRLANLERPEASEGMQEAYYVRFLERAASEPEFVANLKWSIERVEPVFRRLEALRITLAKHEVAKTAGSGRTYMPPYARGDSSTGSMMWLIEDKDGGSEFVSRRSIADSVRALTV